MNLKAEVTHLFDEINHNLNNITPTKIALENAIRKPIHQAFKSVPKEHYRKVYKEISKVTHPDRMIQALSDTVSEDPIVLFHSKIFTLAQTLEPSERDAFLRTPQQLVETYKDRLPDVAELFELASHTTLLQLISKLQKAMISILKRSFSDSERYNIYIQWVIYSIQVIVNLVLILVFGTLIGAVGGVAHILFYYYFSLTLACLLIPLFAYSALRKLEDTLIIKGINAPLLYFIGEDALDKALKELMPVSQLASDYRAYFKDQDEIEFTEEDSDETVLTYAKEKFCTKFHDYDIECKRLRRENIRNKPFWQYPQILVLGFVKAMQMTLPLEQSLVSQQASSEPKLDHLLFHYKRERGQTLVYDIVNGKVCHDSSAKPWIGFYHDTPNESVVSSKSSRAIDLRNFEVVTQQGMNHNNLPIIHHIENTLYSWNEAKQTLEQLTLKSAREVQLPSDYINSPDSVFYYDRIDKRLSRLSFNEAQDHCRPKSQYIFFGDRLFYYNNFTDSCNQITLQPGPMLDAFKEKFADGTQIETVSAEQLAFIKKNTQHSNQSPHTLFICIKLLQAVCFIPFVITETILYLADLIFKAFAISMVFVAFAIKLGVTQLLNLPLYAYEACVKSQDPPPPGAASDSNYNFTGESNRSVTEMPYRFQH